MKLSTAREIVTSAGLDIRREIDEPEHFESWYLVFAAGDHEYRIARDGRDGIVALERAVGTAYDDVWYAPNASPEELREQIDRL